jgi:Domain of unknown function (DUF5753)/Domain of unknown function (DUF397)
MPNECRAMLTVPGRPQASSAPGCARAILSARPDGNLADLEEQVAARMARQNILDRTGGPQLWSILDEGVLHRAIGGPKVMRSQLYRLAEVAEHPRTTIQVIRYSGDNGGTCIEVGTTGPAVAVRDSQDQAGPQLAFPAAAWRVFTGQLKTTSC